MASSHNTVFKKKAEEYKDNTNAYTDGVEVDEKVVAASQREYGTLRTSLHDKSTLFSAETEALIGALI